MTNVEIVDGSRDSSESMQKEKVVKRKEYDGQENE